MTLTQFQIDVGSIDFGRDVHLVWGDAEDQPSGKLKTSIVGLRKFGEDVRAALMLEVYLVFKAACNGNASVSRVNPNEILIAHTPCCQETAGNSLRERLTKILA